MMPEEMPLTSPVFPVIAVYRVAVRAPGERSSITVEQTSTWEASEPNLVLAVALRDVNGSRNTRASCVSKE
jgi:hypothetical protein